MIWIDRFPLPPSVNEYLMPVAGRWTTDKKGRSYRKGRWVKTDLHRKYVDACWIWARTNRIAFDTVQSKILDMKKDCEFRGKPFALRVDCWFVFHVERVFTEAGLPHRIDSDNRLKPCRDALAEILGIDDKYFFAGHCEKVTTRSKELECSIIRVVQMTPRTLEEIKALMNPIQGS